MAESYVGVRLEVLRKAQNSDGGWGYFAGKSSWLEPTAYAALALHGGPEADRAWKLIRSWQGSDGSVRPTGNVDVPSWGAALLVTVGAARNDFSDPQRQAVNWLLDSAGVESRWINRMASRLGMLNAERDLSLKGWPWKPDTSSWVEPTAHALVALRKTVSKFPSDLLNERILLGQSQLLDVRCRDGGWNYGSRAVLNTDLPSYPETTGLALLGLQGHKGIDLSLQRAGTMLAERVSPLAQAWLSLALRVHGRSVPSMPEKTPVPKDLQVVALEALAAPEGNFRFFQTEAGS